MNKRLLRQATGLLDRMLIGGLLLLVLLMLGLRVARAGEIIPSIGIARATDGLGAGFTVPLAPMAAIDVNVRYIFMKDQASQLPPNSFDPDSWTTTVGLAFRF